MNIINHLARIALPLTLALALFSPPTTLALSPSAPDSAIQGIVTRVSDGDTVTVQTERGNIKARLAGIDAPELAMPYGREAKSHLRMLLLDQPVRVIAHKKDRYGRTVGTIQLGHSDVSLMMVEAGFAWHFKKYAHEQSAADARSYALAEQRASARQRGLWQDSGAMPPWEWRTLARNMRSSKKH